jgi:hypothetical protein
VDPTCRRRVPLTRSPPHSLPSGTAPSASLRARAHPLSLGCGPCPSGPSPSPTTVAPMRVRPARSNRAHATTTHPHRTERLGEDPAPPQLAPASHSLSPRPRAHSACNVALSVIQPFRRPRQASVVVSSTVSFVGALCTGNPLWFSLSSIPLPGPRSTPPLRRTEFTAVVVSRRPINRSPLAPCQAAPSVVSG